ncbi:hypothetical protein [Streptomyces luteolus]|uniref:Uncharacterized protein n=1 Tax=Streptomyces luteolus TaxID=3043615 RepID=A0ABT6SZ75_9ACTN|nr:hypothetical protein [Streptomyces sp. B-S-A12]MDI3420896.1 hypothetical protein [Streptomyces sp. B-S-A12]
MSDSQNATPEEQPEGSAEPDSVTDEVTAPDPDGNDVKPQPRNQVIEVMQIIGQDDEDNPDNDVTLFPKK